MNRHSQLWADQADELTRDWTWVQIFENRGEQMGASNPHPHGQLWAVSWLPQRAEVEDRQQRMWHEELTAPLLVRYAEAEAEADEARG